jgi:hypothetical protein
MQGFQHVQRQIWDIDDEEGMLGEVLERLGKKIQLDPMA